MGFTSNGSNAIFLGNSGSHAILKVLLACPGVQILGARVLVLGSRYGWVHGFKVLCAKCEVLGTRC